MHIFNRRRLTVWLYPLSLLFRLAVALRNFLYDRNLLHSVKVNVPIISVGNLAVGGTGKTPAVEYLARLLLKNNLRPAIVTRGYRRKARGTVVVADGQQICATVEASGDEAMQLARQLKQVVIIADERKARGALYAGEHFEIDVIIIDDGFQHRRLRRDFDIVLIDALSFSTNRWMLPAGPFRESGSALRRAEAIILTHADKTQLNELSALEAFCHKFSSSTLLLEGMLQPQFFENIATGERLPLSAFQRKRVFAVGGIAQPARFFEALQQLGATVAGKMAYPDHHGFTAEEMTGLFAHAQTAEAEALVLTEKDATKWAEQMSRPPLPVLFLRVEFCSVTDTTSFDRQLLERFRRKLGHHAVNLGFNEL